MQTPLIARFSTVIHEKGSPETLPDPRGFAVKMYTREGNFDMVGNNMPVFFVRDAMQVLIIHINTNPGLLWYEQLLRSCALSVLYVYFGTVPLQVELETYCSYLNLRSIT